ncbi:BnaA01g07320D [Brassica napus]|uniref:BnaA01g07320D protein n=1 Tax=Brassica napus TaxID=3708 RepID=A0A078I0B1_BRANA|nr:BnaA01g07320D [Brassica napus]
MAEGIVIVFDFDRTLIDGDSDNWVVTEMGLTEIFHQLRFTLPWNRLMDRMMTELHSQGRSIQDIEACLQRIMPIDSHIVDAIKSAKSLGCDLKIVSDANQFFIEKILEQHDLLDCFSDIYTNPTSVDENGKLRISPYHGGAASTPHSCNLCPPNLCKGLVMDHIRASSSRKDQVLTRFIYLGDGGGDFCPTLKLRECDCVMPRTNYPLWKRISDKSSLIKADVKEWSSAEELQRILMQLFTSCEYLLVGSSVKLGNGCKLYPSNHIFGNTELGESCVLMTGAVVGDELPGGYTVIVGNNIIGHHAVVGIKCQDLKYKVYVDECFLCIGNNNEIREFCSIHTSSTSADKTIGDNNLIMGSSGATVIHKFCHIGSFAFIGGGSVIHSLVLLYTGFTGERAELRGLNLEELRRNGFTTSEEHNQELCSVPAVGAM